jgi:hypothetical protein
MTESSMRSAHSIDICPNPTCLLYRGDRSRPDANPHLLKVVADASIEIGLTSDSNS